MDITRKLNDEIEKLTLIKESICKLLTRYSESEILDALHEYVELHNK